MAYENNRFNNRNNYNDRNNYNNRKQGGSEYLELVDLTQENYVELAEKVINHINKTPKNLISTSQIRGLLSLNSEIYNSVALNRNKQLDDDVISRLQYLKVRCVYDSGRDSKVKCFVMNSHLIDYLNKIGNSKEKYLLFARYMEALVAYRKFKGAKADA